ncbi:MAG: helix-turn-helix domain-containing protein [Gaiellaceae bacterium]
MREASSVPRQRTRESITDALPRVLEEQGVSARELARQIGINQSYLSLVVAGRRALSRKIPISPSKALGLPADYFREAREALVLEKIKADPRILDRVYDLVAKGK